VIAAAFNAYLLVLLGAAVRGRRRRPPAACTATAFAILVPARDEERSVAATVASLLAVDYPPERIEVIVVADRCTDGTAPAAAAAGATVWERSGGEDGKGAALAWAFARVLERRPRAEAVVVVDADCAVAPNLLAAVAGRLRDGARAVQVAYRVGNAEASPVAALRFASFALVNEVRPLGKTALGLSAGLSGTGMAFTRDVVARHGWPARSLVEDQEQHLALVHAGERVVFAPETCVVSAMPTSLRQASSQQLRWDAGRSALIRAWTPRLLARAARRRDGVRLHAALEPLVPPQSLLLLLSAAGLAGARGRRLAVANLVAQGVYVAGALVLVRAPAPVWRALAFAPLFAAHKLTALARLAAGRGPTEWVRTERPSQPAAARSRRPMRRSWSRRTYARSSGSARGARRTAAPSQPAR
jgi:1,2-diacylglycerol 3-beta-glucosyltransferase